MAHASASKRQTEERWTYSIIDHHCACPFKLSMALRTPSGQTG